MEKRYFIERPDLTPYEGVVVDKDTNITFSNGIVKQEIKDLKLVSKVVNKTDKYKITNILEINLEEGEIILLENENRGWFLPKEQTDITTINNAIKDYEALKEALIGEVDINDITRNEKKNS